MPTTSTPTSAVFRSHCANMVSLNSTRTCSKVGGRLNRKGLFLGSSRSRVCLRPLIRMKQNEMILIVTNTPKFLNVEPPVSLFRIIPPPRRAGGGAKKMDAIRHKQWEEKQR